MAQFICNTVLNDRPANVTLEQDSDEVNILVNGNLIAWFDRDGCLYVPRSESEELKSVGVVFDQRRIKVKKV